MTDQIRARFAELSRLVDTIERTSAEVERQLEGLTKQVHAVTEMWTGAGSDGFQAKVTEWFMAADDLRESLRHLARVLSTTNSNYRGAVTTNTGMWPVPGR